jgi:multidrug efflux pump
MLQVKDSTPPRDVPGSWYQVRKKVGDMRGTLPQGVIGPVFNDDFGDVYGSIFALSADGFSPEDLRQHAERVRSAAARAGRGQGELFGVQAEKVFVEISQKKLAQLGLDMSQVIAQINAQNAVEAGGAAECAQQNGCWCASRASSSSVDA